MRASKPLEDRMDVSVGPMRIEIIEPLERLRVVVEPNDADVAMDVTWTASHPAFEEPRQYLRAKGTVIFDTQRFAQLGRWEGTLSVGGTDFAVTPDHCGGSRDRSWGVRPVGEKQPDGIRQDINAMAGMWTYMPVDFGDHSIIYMCHEEPSGNRPLEEGVRVWHDRNRPDDWLGRPEWEARHDLGHPAPVREPDLVPGRPGGSDHHGREAADHELHLGRDGLRHGRGLAARHVAGRLRGGPGTDPGGRRGPAARPVRRGRLGGRVHLRRPRRVRPVRARLLRPLSGAGPARQGRRAP
ncbi:MAG: hypothetical protein R2695_19325 [Acidimicrobiales bacterium]